MNITDPFGRLGARRERDYASFKRTLEHKNVTSSAQVEQLMRSTQQRGQWALFIIIPVTLIAAMLWNEAAFFIVGTGLLLALWVRNMTRNGQLFLQRYIDESRAEPTEAPEQVSAR